jgi:hypothetical protein
VHSLSVTGQLSALDFRFRDRVVQGALKLILEPIFEADFQSGSYGYRPKRTAHEAVYRVAQAIDQRKTIYTPPPVTLPGPQAQLTDILTTPSGKLQ